MLNRHTPPGIAAGLCAGTHDDLSEGAPDRSAPRRGEIGRGREDCSTAALSPPGDRSIARTSAAVNRPQWFLNGGIAAPRASDKGKPGESRRRKAPRLPSAR